MFCIMSSMGINPSISNVSLVKIDANFIRFVLPYHGRTIKMHFRKKLDNKA